MTVETIITETDGNYNTVEVCAIFSDGVEIGVKKSIPKNKTLEKWYMKDLFFELSRLIERKELNNY